eukprot:TRINITY_DN32204_c0_g1_i2.p1 TRINITY_DN32204_c0_g1~~TRINITY_DN32204_c0_g1_i2.p1  ORF type:complete len:484 (-),score=41.29 TRINITY_DN32204_c0_g1_i2:13-1317(-)
MEQFTCFDEVIQLPEPRFLAFSPLWPTGSSSSRRLAIANANTAHIYRMSESQPMMRGPGEVPQPMSLESTLEFEENFVVTAVLFRDEDTARALVIAFGPDEGAEAPRSPRRGDKFYVRVWSCEAGSSPTPRSPPSQSRLVDSPLSTPKALGRQAYLASMEEHVSSTYLLSADTSGECKVWQKNRNFARRAAARLHQGPITDLAVDRHYVYSLGQQELSVKVWAVSDLKTVLSVSMEVLNASSLSGFDGGQALWPQLGSAATVERLDKSATQGGLVSCRLAQLTAVRRPASRWSGAQGSARTAGAPRGLLFVAGAAAKGQDLAGEDAAVLMEWTLGSSPSCLNAIVAHATPIVSMAYGPFDNGPLVTADSSGLCRVWAFTPRLWCSQQIEARQTPGIRGAFSIAIASDPLQRALYSIAGEKRLQVWAADKPLDRL